MEDDGDEEDETQQEQHRQRLSPPLEQRVQDFQRQAQRTLRAAIAAVAKASDAALGYNCPNNTVATEAITTVIAASHVGVSMPVSENSL